MNHNVDIAAALGKRLWRTDSFVPRYRRGEIERWRINAGGQLVTDWGYFSGPCLLEMLPSLTRKAVFENDIDRDVWETWMSLTPHEIESHAGGQESVVLKRTTRKADDVIDTCGRPVFRFANYCQSPLSTNAAQ